jgi:hypothetical protein
LAEPREKPPPVQRCDYPGCIRMFRRGDHDSHRGWIVTGLCRLSDSSINNLRRYWCPEHALEGEAAATAEAAELTLRGGGRG